MAIPERARRTRRQTWRRWIRSASLGGTLGLVGTTAAVWSTDVAWHSVPPTSFSSIAPFLGLRTSGDDVVPAPRNKSREERVQVNLPPYGALPEQDYVTRSVGAPRAQRVVAETVSDPAAAIMASLAESSAASAAQETVVVAEDNPPNDLWSFPILDAPAREESPTEEAASEPVSDGSGSAPPASPADMADLQGPASQAIVNPYARTNPPESPQDGMLTADANPDVGGIASLPSKPSFPADSEQGATEAMRSEVATAQPETFAESSSAAPRTSESAARTGQPDPSILPIGQPAEEAVAKLNEGAVRQAQDYINLGIRQAERGAIYSSRAQFIKVLRLVSQSLDAEEKSTRHADALAKGLRALDEAADFRPPGSALEANLELAPLVAAHRTPVLKQQNLSRITPLAATQAYHGYAEKQLALAGGRELVAADAFFGLAKLQPHLRVGDSEHEQLDAPVAMSYYQAALMVYPDHYLAANELGVLFARCGQLKDACEVFQFAAATNPGFPETWLNLSRVHERLGEQEMAQRAYAEWQAASRLANRPGEAQLTQTPAVQWMEPAEFARGGAATAGAESLAARTSSLPPGRSSAVRSSQPGSARVGAGSEPAEPPASETAQRSFWPFTRSR